MIYSSKQINQLHRDFARVTDELQTLNLVGIGQAQQLENERARNFIKHGVGRRLRVLKKATEEIFRVFPPERENVLGHEDVTELQVYLHAFVINLFGVLENWTWRRIVRISGLMLAAESV